jgi:hypothetical protein
VCRELLGPMGRQDKLSWRATGGGENFDHKLFCSCSRRRTVMFWLCLVIALSCNARVLSFHRALAHHPGYKACSSHVTAMGLMTLYLDAVGSGRFWLWLCSACGRVLVRVLMVLVLVF